MHAGPLPSRWDDDFIVCVNMQTIYTVKTEVGYLSYIDLKLICERSIVDKWYVFIYYDKSHSMVQ